MTRVVVLGSSNTDMTVRLARLPAPGETRIGGGFATSPGGKGANQAVAARRAGAEVAFITAVGDDTLGRGALALYEKEGLDVSLARTISGVPSGVALIFVADGGENMIGVAPGANAQLVPADIDSLPARLFAPGAILLASLEVPLATVIRGLERARSGGMTTVLNPAPVDPAILDPEVLALVDVLTPNYEEARALGMPARLAESHDVVATALEAIRLLRGRGVRNIAVTLGPAGCLVASDAACVLIPAPKVEAVDTVGAGDCFNGALAVALAEGRTLVDAAAWACAAGALAVTRPGAQNALPRRDEIDRMGVEAPPPRIVRDERTAAGTSEPN
jgi:ribokinase